MEYPKMIYAEDGRTHVLSSPSAPWPDGEWQDKPFPSHMTPDAPHFATRSIDPEEAMAERIAKHLARILREEPAEMPKRGPGRPRKSSNESDEDA